MSTSATRTIIINAPIHTIYNVIVDYEKYPEFLKEMSSATIVSRNGNKTEVEFTIQVVKSIQYTLALEKIPNTGLRWWLVQSRWMKSSDGSWSLSDLGNGRTQAIYTAGVQARVFVPGKVSRFLQGQMLNATLDAFKKRSESLV